ncbi:MAG TPA: glycoside hydrolase family 2 TIM barrel-domain containing protein [Vicinamibacterales bacterium]|nr:glycoside hydrolase family 2 TIM barrel-domain containing protein [Vicinamibacterales bacterium]
MPRVSTDAPCPRPQLQRQGWKSLNGQWEFALDVDGAIADPGRVVWSSAIEVPFSPETPKSGIGDTGLYRACWYRRSIDIPPPVAGDSRVLLHFGAVDYKATVWANGSMVGSHEGGYTPFTCDLTTVLNGGDRCEVIVRAEDDPLDLEKPRGKQDWMLEPHSIWYPRTTGIWQSVWIERVPSTWIDWIRWTPNMERWEIGCAVWLAGGREAGMKLRVSLSVEGQLLAEDTYSVTGAEVHRRIALSDPGIDDSRNDLLWNPGRPRLIDAELTLERGDGQVLDRVRSYTALRSVAVDGNRFILNGRPYNLRLVLDQGYWPESGLTAPNDDALRRDVELAKAMGFNGVRKHQKIEDPRYLYWADRLGLLVWEEMPSAYRYTNLTIQRTTREWMEAIRRDYSHPCIIALVAFNESWGVPNLPNNPAERHYVRGLYYLTKTLDSTRPVVGNDGWESVATDIIGIHDYDPDPQRLARRYHADDVLPRLFRRERPGGRTLVLEGKRHHDQPLMLTEFGGITYSGEAGTWGYTRVDSEHDLQRAYSTLLKKIHELGVFAGFCYTQFSDTYQEANGLLYADRTPKFPIEAIHAATTGNPLALAVPDDVTASPRALPPQDAEHENR